MSLGVSLYCDRHSLATNYTSAGNIPDHTNIITSSSDPRENSSSNTQTIIAVKEGEIDNILIDAQLTTSLGDEGMGGTSEIASREVDGEEGDKLHSVTPAMDGIRRGSTNDLVTETGGIVENGIPIVDEDLDETEDVEGSTLATVEEISGQKSTTKIAGQLMSISTTSPIYEQKSTTKVAGQLVSISTTSPIYEQKSTTKVAGQLMSISTINMNSGETPNKMDKTDEDNNHEGTQADKKVTEGMEHIGQKDGSQSILINRSNYGNDTHLVIHGESKSEEQVSKKTY